MNIEDPIEPSIQLQFETEKLSRTIKECKDIHTLREIAKELLKLHQTKSAVAEWATRRAAEAEQRAIKAEIGLKKVLPSNERQAFQVKSI